MQWVLLVLWGVIVYYGALISARWLRPVMTVGLLTAMGGQLVLLQLDHLLSWQTALPLHLCSLFGLLSIPLLWRSSGPLYEMLCYLAAPGAFLTLCFPAIVQSSHPVLMKLAFYQLHVLIALMPFFFQQTEKTLPTDPRRALVWGNGYLVIVSVINRFWGTNYLFLRAAPASTPLQWLFSHGSAVYLCALELLCILLFAGLQPVYAHFRK